VLHVGLDLSRKRVDVCLISSEGELVEHFRAPSDRDGLYGLTRRVAVYEEPVRGVVESMNGARFVHDELVRYGWEVLVADAQRVKGLAPLAGKTDKVDARVLAELSFRDLVPAIWLPTPELRAERERSRWRLHLVKHRATLKNRTHSSLIAFGHQVPMADLFGVAGRKLLAELDFPEPWRGHVQASLELIDDLDRRIGEIERRLRRSGCRSSLHPGVDERPGHRMDHRVYDRLRARRDQPLLLACEADRIHRPVPAREPVRRDGPTRAAVQARPEIPALGVDGGRDRGVLAPALQGALPAHQAPPGSPTRRESRADRARQKADRGDLVHADPQPTVQALRSGRRHYRPDCLTVHF
jgi:hypothetical protein